MALSTWISLVFALMIIPLATVDATIDMGVNYGLLGDNLPPPAEVISMFKQYGIGRMRIFDPNPAVLEALRGSKIEVTLGVRNEDIQTLASGQEAAESWFATNMAPYVKDVKFVFVTVGNEVIPSMYASSVAPAMQNLLTVLAAHKLHGIRVTTVVALVVLQNSFPPSATTFSDDAIGSMKDILKVLNGQGSPILMVNAYPYFPYVADPDNIHLDYVMFTSETPVVHDGNLGYYNMLSAMIDSIYWAMEKVGFPNIGVAVSESGWPNAGNGNITTPELAAKYNRNYIQFILQNVGTPKRPKAHIEGFIFAMFNENLKPAGVEQNWGLFYPTNKQPVYTVFG